MCGAAIPEQTSGLGENSGLPQGYEGLGVEKI